MRLSDAVLRSYKGPAARPDYDRRDVTPGILHLGIGAFHRAHQAACIDQLLAGDPGWGIVGASLRSPAMAAALTPQDGLYTLAELGSGGMDTRIIGSVLGVIDASAEPARLTACLADPRIRIVTLTVTEKGYCNAGGTLDEAHPDIAAEIADGAPRSVPGRLVAGLAARRAAGAGPLTLLSCDNLSENGPTLRATLLRYAALRDPGLADWIAEHTRCPATMVDRITPAMTEADAAAIIARTGLADAAPVVTEPFSQWVIEDDFAAPRPDFSAAGAEMVVDVRAHETMKLRLLNGAHSTMAYLGQLRGHTFVSEAVADPGLRVRLIRTAEEEVFPTLSLPRATLDAYWAALLDRFANPALRHRLDQIAQDGSLKMPLRILGPLAEGRATGRSIDGLTLALAGWIVWVGRRLASGLPLADPLAAALGPLASGEAGAQVAHVASLPGLLSDALRADREFLANLTRAVRSLA